MVFISVTSSVERIKGSQKYRKNYCYISYIIVITSLFFLYFILEESLINLCRWTNRFYLCMKVIRGIIFCTLILLLLLIIELKNIFDFTYSEGTKSLNDLKIKIEDLSNKNRSIEKKRCRLNIISPFNCFFITPSSLKESSEDKETETTIDSYNSSIIIDLEEEKEKNFLMEYSSFDK